MRSYLELLLRVTEDDQQQIQLFNNNIGFDDNADTRNAELSVQRISLAASAADIAVAFGPIATASLMLLTTDSDISIKLNGNTVAIPVRITAAAIGGVILSHLQKKNQPGVVLWRGDVSSISLTNLSSTVAANVTVALVGNA